MREERLQGRCARGRRPAPASVLLGSPLSPRFHNGVDHTVGGVGPFFGGSFSGTAGIAATLQQSQQNAMLAHVLGGIETQAAYGYGHDCFCQGPRPLPYPGHPGPAYPQSNGIEQLLPLLLAMGMGGLGGGGLGSPYGIGGGGNQLLLLLILMLLMQHMQQGQQGQYGRSPFGPQFPFDFPVGSEISPTLAHLGQNFPTGAPNGIPFNPQYLQQQHIPDGDHQGVKFTSGNPGDWYFAHGQHTNKETEFGFTDEGGNTRIVYHKESQTGFIYKKGESGHPAGCNCGCGCGDGWQLHEIRRNWGGKSASPVILDLDGNNRPDVANGEWRPHAGKFDANRTAQFDINGDGTKERTEWVGPNDGLLVHDKDGDMEERLKQNGRLDISGKELLGDEGGKYKDGYEKMRALGLDGGTGAITGDNLNKVKVWRDANGDGVVNAGELVSAGSLGISSIKTTHDGNYRSSFTRDGRDYQTWDWWPSYLN